MSVLVKIRTIKDSLTNNETKIADFALRSPQMIKDLSSQKLGVLVGVSQSSIVKFTQKLGYKGYTDFKFALVEAANQQSDEVPLHGDITTSDSFSQLNKKLLANKVKALNETSGLNEADKLEHAIKTILSAKRILVAGIGASGLVAKDFSHKLQKIGKPAFAEPSGHIQLAGVATFGEDDLVICLSESGTTPDIVAAAELAKKVGANVISITRYSENPLIKSADVALYTVAESSSMRLSSIVARTSQEFVIDLLFIGLTQTSRKSRKYVEQSNQAVEQFVKRKK
ncbi:MurR/RpiR family transcriptional regulator [Thalassotalea agarivorans]|uniref:Transcriptional regulator, RpiR family n=1 Tax=Thalassotalea agarivorans TaxID=349064 RepID=A0A1I0CY12_THASX|nr:MurR/RpiR family transcriptional regulator [Thalassotalea agarivorans]SET24751.1 transcriptional regulator, RpiR family [Thalassotalea agarivorans]